MLTFILLVVLAGGVGLAAVSAAERNDPATPRTRTRRGDRPRPADEVAEHDSVHDHADAVGDQAFDESFDEPALPSQNPELPRRSRRGDVPRSRTAVEGAFGTVAIAPPGRRVMSLVILVVLSVGVAVVIAGSFGLVAAAIGRIIDSAIG